MLLAIIIILLIFGGGFGYWGSGRGYGYAGWSPLGIILIILVVWLLLGRGPYY
jgi:hypothetical protein